VHVHVRAVEERVSFGQQRDRAAGRKVLRENIGRFGVEVVERASVPTGMIGRLRGHRIHQLFFELGRAQIRFGHRSCDRPTVPSAVVGDNVCFTDDAGCLHRDEFAVTRADPDAPESSLCCHVTPPSMPTR